MSWLGRRNTAARRRGNSHPSGSGERRDVVRLQRSDDLLDVTGIRQRDCPPWQRHRRFGHRRQGEDDLTQRDRHRAVRSPSGDREWPVPGIDPSAVCDSHGELRMCIQCVAKPYSGSVFRTRVRCIHAGRRYSSDASFHYNCQGLRRSSTVDSAEREFSHQEDPPPSVGQACGAQRVLQK